MESTSENYTYFRKFLDLKKNVNIKDRIDLTSLKDGYIVKHNMVSLADTFDIPLNTMCELSSISLRTLQRYKPDKSLPLPVADRVVSLASLFVYGVSVFENKESFKKWLEIPLRAFKGKRPIDILDSITGIELVNDEIERIEHGVYI